jgi:hypothetical protein
MNLVRIYMQLHLLITFKTKKNEEPFYFSIVYFISVMFHH